jgi:hypothetical protein
LLRSATTAADVDLIWMETPLDAGFSLIRQHHTDAGLGCSGLQALCTLKKLRRRLQEGPPPPEPSRPRSSHVSH